MLAAAVHALIVFGLFALVIFSPIRSAFHDTMLRSPWFPLMAPREQQHIWPWLGVYAVILPVCHYSWIRAAQPTKGAAAGQLLVVCLVVAALLVLEAARRPSPLITGIIWSLLGATATAALVGTFFLYRRLEVRA
jgi:uncharacterized membrane protein